MKNNFIHIVCIAALSFSCSSNDDTPDASGSFEAVETIIAAEATGKILSFTISEGEQLNTGQLVGAIDSTQLYLTRMQLVQNKKAILRGGPDTKAQIESLKKELANAIDDRNRNANLVKGGVASQKQLDDTKLKSVYPSSKNQFPVQCAGDNHLGAQRTSRFNRNPAGTGGRPTAEVQTC